MIKSLDHFTLSTNCASVIYHRHNCDLDLTYLFCVQCDRTNKVYERSMPAIGTGSLLCLYHCNGNDAAVTIMVSLAWATRFELCCIYC